MVWILTPYIPTGHLKGKFLNNIPKPLAVRIFLSLVHFLYILFKIRPSECHT